MTKKLIDERVGEIKVVAIEGSPLNYALDDDGKIYSLCDVVTIVKEQDERIQELEEENQNLEESRNFRLHLVKNGNFTVQQDDRGHYEIYCKQVLPKDKPIITVHAPSVFFNKYILNRIVDAINELNEEGVKLE